MINPRWRKVVRDLGSNRGRTALVVLAIAVGVVAFGSVFSSREILLKDMTRQYRAVNPASITLNIPAGFDDDLVQWITKQPGISAASGTARHLVRLYTPSGSRNVHLVVANHELNHVNIITPETGSWPPNRQELVFERKSADVSGKVLGDQVEIELPNGDKRILDYVGIVHDYTAIPANMFPELTGYINFSTATWLGFPEHYTSLNIVTAPDLITKEAATELAETLKKRLENRGFSSITVTADKPGKHWGEDPTNAFVMILTIVGSFSLILSVFLVINTITAVIAQQKKQIGIMKAIGGTNRALMQLYLTMTLAYGCLALVLALPLGALMSQLNLSLVTNFLNLNTPPFYLPLFIVAIEAMAALGVPIIAAAIPIYTGMKLSVREALSDFSTASTSNSWIDQLTRGIPLLSRPTLLSIRNTFRKKTRLALTLVTLTIAGTLFISVMCVQDAMMLELDNILKLYNYDIELFFSDTYPESTVVKQALKTEGVTSAESPKYASGKLINSDGITGESIQIYGLDPQSDYMQATILDGRWIDTRDQLHLVISSKMVRDNPALGVGKTLDLEINQKTFQFVIVGVFMLPDQKMIVINEPSLIKLLPTSRHINSVRVRTTAHTGTALFEIAKRLEENVKQSGLNVAYTLTIDTIRSSSTGQFSFMTNFLLLMAGMVAVVGGLSLAGTMSLNVLERTREIGVMRSIGASNASIRSLVIVESLLIGCLSWLIALPLAIPIGVGFCFAIGQAFFEKPLQFVFSTQGCLIWLALVLIVASLASFAPANHASKLTIRETLSYE